MSARNERKLRALKALADGRWQRIPEWAEATGIVSPAPGPAYKQTRGAYVYAGKLERDDHYRDSSVRRYARSPGSADGRQERER
jgi:hypothetical protein